MKVIATEKAPGAIGPYSQGFLTNGFVYTSGQIPVNPADGTIKSFCSTCIGRQNAVK